jgi:hypothetical protein
MVGIQVGMTFAKEAGPYYSSNPTSFTGNLR